MDSAGEIEWRHHHKSLGEQLWYMYQFGVETDLEIHLYDDQIRKNYRCHKVIFLRLSSIFQILIEDYAKEEGEVCSISLSQVKPAAFEMILQYAYTDKLELSSLTDAFEIKEFCINYDISNLKALCEDYISKFDICSDSVWEIIDNSITGKKLGTKVKKFLFKNTKECIQSPRFLSCSQTSLLRLLSLQKLNVDSELQLVQAAIQWAKVQNGGLDLDPQSSKELLGPCLAKLRFLTLTPAEFSKNIAKSGLFSSEDTLKILINLTAPNCEMELPEDVSTLTIPRTAVSVAELVKMSTQADLSKIVCPSEIKKEAHDQQVVEKTPVFCFRGSHPGLDSRNKLVRSPAKFNIVAFKVNKSLLLTGIRIPAQLKGTGTTRDTYDEYLHISVIQEKDKKRIAHLTHIAPVNYDAGIVDVVFSKPGALVAGENYLLDINIKSQGVYLSKARSHTVCVKEYNFTFSADYERFPFSGILQSLSFDA